MGIFGDDKRQDERIAALESHVRILTETVQVNQADLAEGRIAILELQAQVDEKVSSSDVDPTIVKLNQELATGAQATRRSLNRRVRKLDDIAERRSDAFETLRKSVSQASDKTKKA